jgi:[ribosomal protein S5]-alanine N-acetyltransferase
MISSRPESQPARLFCFATAEEAIKMSGMNPRTLPPLIPIISTNRLRLQPFSLLDAKDVQRLAGDPAIADTTLCIPHPYPDGAAEDWIATHSNEFEKGEGATFAIKMKSDAALIGAISLMQIKKGHQAELGYWIGKPYWRRGYCTEAARALLNYAFLELGLIRVHACHFARNPASGRVLQNIGMQYEGIRRHHVMKWDKPEDLALYGILKDEWICISKFASHEK